METTLSTLIAVLGTLLGAVVAHRFQRRVSQEDRRFTAQQQLRAERMAVYSDLAGALSELRRGQHDRWHRANEDPDSTTSFDARVEAYRLKGVALHAFFRVQLVASTPRCVEAARRAYESACDTHKASDRPELSRRGEQAAKALEDFITLASTDLR